jgi:hypothetical protein
MCQVRRDRVSLLERVQSLEAQKTGLEEALAMAEGKLRLVRHARVIECDCV